MYDSEARVGFPFARHSPRLAVLLLAAAVLAGCMPFELSKILNGPTGKSLSLTPDSIVLPAAGTVTFTAVGGVPPYTYSIAAGGGTLDSATGFYTAPGTLGPATIRARDATGKTADATVSVQVFSASLVINPPALSLMVGSNVTFAAIGGTPPYTYDFASMGTGSPTFSPPGSGHYVTGASPGTDLVRVTDAAMATSIATVTVTAVTSTVDYTITATSFPPSGTTGNAVPGGYSFDLTNSGAGNGTQTVSWSLFLSSDGVINGGDQLVGSGTAPPQPAGQTIPVTISGTFPAVPAGSWNLIARVGATDDGTAGNNDSGPSAVSLSLPNINYRVDVGSPANTGATITGAQMDGTISLTNIGSVDGTPSVDWTVYASLDGVLDLGDYVIARGTHGALNASQTSGAIAFSGQWPSTPNTWQLIGVVSAADDWDASNNTGLGDTIAVTGPPPANVDYSVVSLSATGTTAGDPLSSGSFTIQNNGTDSGSQPILWTAYVSSNSTLEIGTDPVMDSGSEPSVGSVTFNGTWPLAAGTWHILVAVSASDDILPGNNVTSIGPITTTAPFVDYQVEFVVNNPGTTAGGPLSGSFKIENIGSHNGSQFIPLSIYLSTDAALGVGDSLIASGSIPAPGLTAGFLTAAIPFADTWPAANVPRTWYFIVRIGAGDDIAAGNDTAASAGIVVNPPDINYRLTSVTNTGGTTTGGAIGANFVLDNIGTAGGTVAAAWTAYLSSNNTLEVTDQVLATGFAGPLGPSGTSGGLGFGGTWPGAGSWFLIVKADASDDTTPGNNVQFTGPIAVTDPPAPDYTVSSFDANIPWSGLIGTAMSATGTPQFTIQNQTANLGHATITWSVYLSLDKVLDGGDSLVQTSTIAPLGGSGSQVITFGGNWLAAKTYYLIATVNAADDSNHTNDAVPAPHVSAVGNYRYTEIEPNDDNGAPPPPLTIVSDTLVTTLGGNQTLVIEGIMDGFDGYDTYKFTTVGSMSKLNMSSYWQSGFDDIDLYLWDNSGTDLSSVSVGLDSEPGAATFNVTGVTPRICFVSANFYLANGTSGSTGKTYVIVVTGKP